MAFKPESILIGLIVFSLIVTSGLFLIKDITVNYPETNMNTSDFDEVYDSIDTMYNISEAQKSQVKGAEISSSEAYDNSIKGSFNAARFIWDAQGVIVKIVNSVAKKIGIPVYLLLFFYVTLTLIIVWALIRLFIRY